MRRCWTGLTSSLISNGLVRNAFGASVPVIRRLPGRDDDDQDVTVSRCGLLCAEEGPTIHDRHHEVQDDQAALRVKTREYRVQSNGTAVQVREEDQTHVLVNGAPAVFTLVWSWP
jgi:hypothetical protein